MALDEGSRWMQDEDVILCRFCELPLGPEWWVCPSCEREWLDAADRPQWPVFYCSQCGTWNPHELLWCTRCCLVRDLGPRHVENTPRGEEGEVPRNHFPDERADSTMEDPLRRPTPVVTGTDRTGRPMTDAERGAVGLSSASGSYRSPDAHRPRCQICHRRPGCRVWCVYCRRGVGPGCCLLCEFPRTDRRRRGCCVQCLPIGGEGLGMPVADVNPLRL